MKPRMFIASSAERVDLAYAAQENLEREVEVTVWTQGVFKLSRTGMASLMDQLDESDFGLFVLAPDDVTTIRNKVSTTVRDNVIFELGLFAGRLGIERCFLVVPRGCDDLHLPSDLMGLAPAEYDPDRQDENLMAALGPACNRVRKAVEKLGPLAKITTPPETVAALESEEIHFDDPADCIALIQSWMGNRSAGQNSSAIHYNDVDRQLKLKPGSARLYLEKAAAHFGYVTEQKGKDVILFRKITKNIRRSSFL